MRGLPGFLAPLLLACSIPPLEVTGKTCEVDLSCPSGWVCTRSTAGDTCQPGIAFQAGFEPAADYAAMRDAPLREAFPSTPAPGATLLTVDFDEPEGSGHKASAALYFDVSAVPVDAEVKAVSMRLTFRNQSAGEPHNMYLLLRSWTQDATWLEAAPGAPWAAPGASGASDRGELVGVWAPAALGPLELELNDAGLGAVRAWLDNPSSNHGFVIDSPSTNGADFVSQEGAEPAERPRLILRY